MLDRKPELGGVLPVLVTPFHDDGVIDEDSLRRQIEFELDTGVDGVVLFGLVGEGFKLSDAERDRVMAVAAETIAGRAPLVVAVEHNGTAAAADRARRAADLGATALMAMPPSFQSSGRASLVDYFTVVSGATDLPLVVQDAPRASGVVMDVDLLAQLYRDVPHLVGVKVEAPPTPSKMAALRSRPGCEAMVLLGGMGGRSFLPELAAGATGTMIGPAFPEPFRRVLEATREGDRELATHEFHKVLPLLCLAEGNDAVTHGHKALLHAAGIIAAARVREPTGGVDDRMMTDWWDMARRCRLAVLDRRLSGGA